METFRPIRDGRGNILLEREVPIGARHHGRERAELADMVKGHEAKMNALGNLPLAAEDAPMPPTLWNRFVNIFKPKAKQG